MQINTGYAFFTPQGLEIFSLVFSSLFVLQKS